jgi:tRNA(Ile)-lysidine synthase
VLAADPFSSLTGVFDGLMGFSRVAVAVSGGSDSMALLRLVQHWRNQSLGPQDVQALTFDHGLREGSAEEALRVEAWCAALGIPHEILVWQGSKPTTGLQAKARAARYDALTDWCRAHHVPVLLTGHTADDQAETVAMRKSRTSSDRSLAAIWPENEWHGVKLMRPLLARRRADLRTYLESLGQGYLDDPSNDDVRFERVRVRKAMSPAAVGALQAEAEDAQLRVRELDAKAQHWLKAFMDVDAFAVMRLARKTLLAESATLQVAIMRWALRAAGDAGQPEPSAVDALLGWMGSGQTSRRSVNGAIVSARRHVIEIMREPSRIRAKFTAVPVSGRMTFDGRFDVVAPPGASLGPMGVPPLLKRWKEVPAYAFSALPCVKLADGALICAVKSNVEGISATLCERFRL